MKKNLTELGLLSSLYALGVLIKALNNDDDDEDNNIIANFTLNQLNRLETDITFYTSPISMEKISRNILPIFTLIIDIDEFRQASVKYLKGEDIIKTGINAGDSRITREFLQLFPFSSSYYRLKSASNKITN